MRNAARVGILVLLTVVTVTNAEAASRRKRGVRPVANPIAQCHTFGFVRAGLKATYKSISAGGTVTFVVTYLSDNATQTKTTQKVTTPQAVTDVESTIDSEVVEISAHSSTSTRSRPRRFRSSAARSWKSTSTSCLR